MLQPSVCDKENHLPELKTDPGRDGFLYRRM
jgi:hypothetical protein